MVGIWGDLTVGCNSRVDSYYDAVAGYNRAGDDGYLYVLSLTTINARCLFVWTVPPRAASTAATPLFLVAWYCTWLSLAVPTSKWLSPEQAHHLTGRRL